MSTRARLMVTNDDGIDSPGLQRLAKALSEDYEVVVAAPSGDRSGSGTGIGRFDPNAGVELTPTEFDGTEAYSIDGPPGLAVMAAALGAFGRLPDMVVSGINSGVNTGHSIIHSGTVGAALTARTFKMRGLAVSLAPSEPWHWDTAVDVALASTAWMLARRSTPHVLNVNVPALPISAVKGIHWADLDSFGHFQVATVEGRRLQFTVGSPDSGSESSSDTWLCESGVVTLTPLSAVEPAPFPDEEASSIWKP